MKYLLLPLLAGWWVFLKLRTSLIFTAAIWSIWHIGNLSQYVMLPADLVLSGIIGFSVSHLFSKFKG